MLSKLKEFNYLEPSSLFEAISLLDQYNGKAKIIAGGTDLIVKMKQRKLTPLYLINIKNISDLSYIKYDGQVLRIGALVTHSSVARSSVIQENFSPLGDAVCAVGTVQTRNLATVGGNLCNASPSADTAPALIALGAKLKVVSPEGEKTVKVEDFFTAPFRTILKTNEMLTEIQIPNLPPHSGGTYLWVPKMTAVDETLVGVAVSVAIDLTNQTFIKTGIGLGSVAPTPMRAEKTEEFLSGRKIEDNLLEQAGKVAASEVSPRSREEYRREMVKILVKRALHQSLGRIKQVV